MGISVFGPGTAIARTGKALSGGPVGIAVVGPGTAIAPVWGASSLSCVCMLPSADVSAGSAVRSPGSDVSTGG